MKDTDNNKYYLLHKATLLVHKKIIKKGISISGLANFDNQKSLIST